MDKKRAHYVVSVDRAVNLFNHFHETVVEIQSELDRYSALPEEEKTDEVSEKVRDKIIDLQIYIGDVVVKNIGDIINVKAYLETIDPIFESKTQRLIHNAFFYAISGITGASLFFATKYFF